MPRLHMISICLDLIRSAYTGTLPGVDPIYSAFAVAIPLPSCDSHKTLDYWYKFGVQIPAASLGTLIEPTHRLRTSTSVGELALGSGNSVQGLDSLTHVYSDCIQQNQFYKTIESLR